MLERILLGIFILTTTSLSGEAESLTYSKVHVENVDY